MIEQPRLLFREWLAVGCVIGIIASLAAIAWISEVRTESRFVTAEAAVPYLVKIDVSGAVFRPGTYLVQPGVSLKEALQGAGLTPRADRKKLNLRKIVYYAQAIDVPSKAPRKKKRNS